MQEREDQHSAQTPAASQPPTPRDFTHTANPDPKANENLPDDQPAQSANATGSEITDGEAG